MLPARLSAFVGTQISNAAIQTQTKTNVTNGNKEKQELERNNDAPNLKPEWIENWLLNSVTERRIPENEECSICDEKNTDECNSSCCCYPHLNVERMDSLTSGKSLGSFRIGANRETSTAAIQSLLLKDQSIEKKLLAVGILENCTRLMQTITVPRTVNSYPAPTHAALGQALSNDDAVSVMQFVAATVSMGVNLKFSRIINHSIQQRLKTIARRERQLEDLKDRRLKESKNPEVLYREKRNEEMQTAIKHVQTQNLALKCRIREINEELGHLRLAERDATVTVRRLHDCRDKYSKICDENRELNKIIQELQGRVRVMCQLSKPIRNTMNYLSSPNRGEVTLQMKQKTKSFSVDAVMTGPPSTSSLKEDIFPTLNSVLDGFDAMVLSVGDGGSFISNLTCMMSTLLDAANSRFYHVRNHLSLNLRLLL